MRGVSLLLTRGAGPSYCLASASTSLPSSTSSLLASSTMNARCMEEASTSGASEACSRPHQLQQVRSKTFTSNVMDEVRAKRIRDHFTYHKAMKAWRLEVHSRLETWRAERKASEAAVAEQARYLAVEGRREAAMHEAGRRQGQHLGELERQIRQAQLEHDIAKVRLVRAQRAREVEARALLRQAQRRDALLEASKGWIGSPKELTERINRALDNPRPFGFIKNLERRTWNLDALRRPYGAPHAVGEETIIYWGGLV